MIDKTTFYSECPYFDDDLYFELVGDFSAYGLSPEDVNEINNPPQPKSKPAESDKQRQKDMADEAKQRLADKEEYKRKSKEHKESKRKVKLQADLAKVGGTAIGGAVGLGASQLATKKWRTELNSLTLKPEKTPEDLERMKNLRKKIAIARVAGTGLGAFAGHKVGKSMSSRLKMNYNNNRPQQKTETDYMLSRTTKLAERLGIK